MAPMDNLFDYASPGAQALATLGPKLIGAVNALLVGERAAPVEVTLDTESAIALCFSVNNGATVIRVHGAVEDYEGPVLWATDINGTSYTTAIDDMADIIVSRLLSLAEAA